MHGDLCMLLFYFIGPKAFFYYDLRRCMTLFYDLTNFYEVHSTYFYLRCCSYLTDVVQLMLYPRDS